MSGPMRELTEFVRNDTYPWLAPGPPTRVWTNDTPAMGDPGEDKPALPSSFLSPQIIAPVVVVIALLIIIIVILLCWFCRRKRKALYKDSIEKHAQFRHTVKSVDVFSVEKEIYSNVSYLQATEVTSERCLRYSGEPGICSLPVSGRSASVDCLEDRPTKKSASVSSLRNSMVSDFGYYGSETLHMSSPSLGEDTVDFAPERSLSSDHIKLGKWPSSSVLKGKVASLDRESGLGSTCSQDTATLCDKSISSSDEDYCSLTEISPKRPNSLPRLYPQIKKMEDIPLGSLVPKKQVYDHNENQVDVEKHIKYLRGKFYEMRDRTGCRTHNDGKTFGTTDFTMGVFGLSGGHLQLFDGSATIAIPEGALPLDQEIYLYAFYETTVIDGKSYLRRVIECGPDGLSFKKPVCLSFIPKLISCDSPDVESPVDLSVVFKNNEADKWRELKQKGALAHAEPDYVTVHVDHFTRFTVVPAGATSHGDGNQAQTVPSLGCRKFYVAVYAGKSAAGTTHYRVCFIEKDKDKLKTFNSSMLDDGFHLVVSAPKLFSLSPLGADVLIDVPSLYGCELRSAHNRHVVELDEFDEETVGDIGLPNRDFLLALKQPNSEGIFEVAVHQRKVQEKVLTFSIAMNVNNLKEKLAEAGSPELTHRDVMEFLAGNRLTNYSPNVFFPKQMKLDICTKVENTSEPVWKRLAEVAQLPGNKNHWIEAYVKGKHVTPCYVLLDLIEAKLIAEGLTLSDSCDHLAAMLEKCRLEVAADFCQEWKKKLVALRAPKKEKPVRSPHSRFDFGNLSPSGDELGTIPEDSSLRLPRQNENIAISPHSPHQRHYYRNNSNSSAMSLPSPNLSPLSVDYEAPLSDVGPTAFRPKSRNLVLRKGNREKSGRNDSGIGSDIASPDTESHS